jgi:hypothetical protein
VDDDQEAKQFDLLILRLQLGISTVDSSRALELAAVLRNFLKPLR